MTEMKGESTTFHGGASSEGGEPVETKEFSLLQGVLIASFEHQGAGQFKVLPNRVQTGFFGGLLDTIMFEGKGPAKAIDGWLIKEGWLSDLKPGIHKLRIAATGEWFCTLFQPDLGQASTEFPVRFSGSTGDIIAGTFRVGSRPLLAKLRHDGAGEFVVKLLSLDGTDEREKIEEGQTHLEGYRTSAQPGKEYLVLVKASGDWELEFTEGY